MKRKLKIKWNKFLLRIRIAYNVLFVHEHFVVHSVTTIELENMLKEKPYEISTEYVGLQQYNISTITKDQADSIDDIDYALQKFAFFGEAEFYYPTKK